MLYQVHSLSCIIFILSTRFLKQTRYSKFRHGKSLSGGRQSKIPKKNPKASLQNCDFHIDSWESLIHNCSYCKDVFGIALTTVIQKHTETCINASPPKHILSAAIHNRGCFWVLYHFHQPPQMVWRRIILDPKCLPKGNSIWYLAHSSFISLAVA